VTYSRYYGDHLLRTVAGMTNATGRLWTEAEAHDRALQAEVG
jgi:hypothetical protein